MYYPGYYCKHFFITILIQASAFLLEQILTFPLSFPKFISRVESDPYRSYVLISTVKIAWQCLSLSKCMAYEIGLSFSNKLFQKILQEENTANIGLILPRCLLKIYTQVQYKKNKQVSNYTTTQNKMFQMRNTCIIAFIRAHCSKRFCNRKQKYVFLIGAFQVHIPPCFSQFSSVWCLINAKPSFVNLKSLNWNKVL